MTNLTNKNVVYGFHAILALVRQSPTKIKAVYVDKNKKQARMTKLINKLKQNNIRVESCHSDLLKKQLGDVVHQGVMAVIDDEVVSDKASLSEVIEHMCPDETILILDGVQDPMNLGSCLRVADAAGVKHVILPKDKSASITASARKVAAGAADSIHVHTVTNLVRTLERLKQNDFWVIGMVDGVRHSLYEYSFKGRTAVVLGNEAKGLRQLTQKACDQLLAIPMFGQVESLNVATATAVSLFEICRQKCSIIEQ